MNKTIMIQREWLERLIELKNDIGVLKVTYESSNEAERLNYLLGYIESAEEILNEENI